MGAARRGVHRQQDAATDQTVILQRPSQENGCGRLDSSIARWHSRCRRRPEAARSLCPSREDGNLLTDWRGSQNGTIWEELNWDDRFTGRCHFKMFPKTSHTQAFLPLFFAARLSLFASSSVPGWRWWKLPPFLLKVREYANKLRGRGKEAEKGFDNKHHLRWAGLVDVRKKIRFLFLFEAEMKARKVTLQPTQPPFPICVIFFQGYFKI